ncbi:MAG: RloB domain-containing protein [Bacteroidia bacterium]|nr:RloB domain-containing protein [Bacteroidia bacterium]
MIHRKRNKIRKINQRILILCEGDTEEIYLKGLKATLSRDVQRDISIIITQASDSEPKIMLKEAIAKKEKATSEQQPYKETWLVFDDDNRKNLKTVFSDARKNEINIAYSSISVEFWSLLHFERTAKEYADADRAIIRLTTYIPSYNKTMPDIYDKLQPHYNNPALPNAEWLRRQKEYHNMYESYKHKPITTVDMLTETLLNIEKT